MSKCEFEDCVLWQPDKEECDDCVDGRFLGVVSDYASTCDECGRLTSHDMMYADESTQLGYCGECACLLGLVDS